LTIEKKWSTRRLVKITKQLLVQNQPCPGHDSQEITANGKGERKKWGQMSKRVARQIAEIQ